MSPPAVSENQLAGHSYAQSDCGHHGSPQLKHSHSLMRNFSLRSRNSFSLRRQNQPRSPPPPLPPLAARLENARKHPASASETNSSSSVWKKWRVKCVTHLNTLGGQGGELDATPDPHDTLSCPQRAAKKRSFFLPFLTVSRPVVPFQISSPSSSSSDDSPCAITPQLSNLCAIQDEDDNKVNGDSTPSPCLEDVDGIVELIRQIDGRVDESQTQIDFRTESELNLSVPPLPSIPSSPSSPPLPPLPTTSPPPSAQPSSPSSPSSNVNSELLPLSSTPESNPQSSSNPNLKPSISQKRRAKFTLGDETDLDCDSLAISASSAAGNAVSSSNVGSGAEPVVLPDDSANTTVPVAMPRPPLTRHERFDRGSRDQVGTTSTSAPTTTTNTTHGNSVRRWTLSNALTDEDISDEGLVKELEKMRKILEWDCTPIDRDGHDTSAFFPSASPPPTPCNPWLITQRALLTTRELILTERHYLSSLLLLLCPGSTLTPVPEMMISYAKELVGVSERLLKGMEGEPSVRGVAEVFVDVEGGLGVDGAESAFVGWCGVVGAWFQGDLADADVKKKRKRFASGVGSGEEHPFMISHDGSVVTTSGEHAHTSPLMRNVSTWRKSMPSIAGLGESGVRRKDKDRDRDIDEGDSTDGRGRMSPTFDAVRSSSSILVKSAGISKPIRKPAVRDLAILPTQRVMRYVLLYRDLLANTNPSSSSYPMVERAVEAACRIAEKCDRAQNNATFIQGGFTRNSSSSRSSSTGSSTSMANSSSSSRQFNGKRVMTMPEPSLKLKSGWGSTAQSSSPTSSPTRSHFFLSSPPVSTSPSTSSALPRSSSLSSSKPIPSSLPLPASPPKKTRVVPNALPPPPPPPSSFNSKIPVARSGRSFSSLSTSPSTGSSTTPSPAGTFSFSSSSASASSSSPSLPFTPPPLCLPKSTSNVSSRIPKPLSPM